MVAAIEEIDRDLQALKTAVAALAQELEHAYQRYVKVLGRAVQQQLVLASYHVCTEAYPEAFLKLSFDQRYALQQTLQKVGGEAHAALQDLPALLHRAEAEGWHDPDLLAQVLENLESAIAETLRQVSREANELLQSAEILAKTPIEVVLEVAAKAEAAGRSITSAPNLLTALINPHEGEEEQEPQVIAVYLQGSEIEFLNPPVMAQRNQLRQLITRLKTLHREFSHKQRQRQVAEAAAAWRACWSAQISDGTSDEPVPPL